MKKTTPPATPEWFLLYEHIKLTVYTDGRETVSYLGYPLLLSPAERCILRTLLANIATEGGFCTTDALRTAVAEQNGTACSSAQVAVLIGRINRKAHGIGGRKLVEGVSHHGYRLCPYV